ncbi:MAG: aminodeoxychorismate synthase component I [Gemmatimonadota bacterium]
MLVRELTEAPDPITACEAFLDLPRCVLLESVERFGELGRWSYLGADPFLRLRSRGRRLLWSNPARGWEEEGDPFAALERELALRRTMPEDAAHLPPFRGGAMGYLGYDLLHHLERVPGPRFQAPSLPELDLGFHDWVLAWDHHSGRTWGISTGLPEVEPAARSRRAGERLGAVLERLRGRSAPPADLPRRSWIEGASAVAVAPSAARAVPAAPTFPVREARGVRSTFERDGYLRAVARCREYVLAGDVFQVNLSQRLSLACAEHPLELYRRLRESNPAPFAALLCGEPGAVLSVSPERFLRISGDRVETRPIKGTSARGYTPAHDFALGDDLVASEKDRAENVMIVDLLRNDLSRVAVDGTVRVPDLWRVERHPTVHHLVSTVTARLRPGTSVVDVLRAAFPGGSITGAPKVRAMEIIHELEPTRRGVYCGSIGYVGYDGEADLSIAIRTVTLTRGTAYLSVGGAIVADSDPEAEYRETLLKAAGMLRAWDAPAAAGLR